MSKGTISLGPGEKLSVDMGGAWVDISINEIKPAGSDFYPLAQREPAWRDDLLGFSNLTLGGWGCALTCASMVCRTVDWAFTPETLNVELRDVNGFYGAHLDWSVIPQVVPGLKFDGIVNWTNGPADMAAIYGHLERHPLIVWVDFDPGGGHNTHFVLVTERYGDTDLLCLDPWDGYEGRLLLRYGLRDWTLERAIYGMRPLYVDDGAAPEVYLAYDAVVDSWPFVGPGGRAKAWLRRLTKAYGVR